MEHDFQIGRKLKELRQSKNLSLDEVANLTLVSKPMLSQIERDKSIPSLNTLWKLATGLRVPLYYFLKGDLASYQVLDLRPIAKFEGESVKMHIYPFVNNSFLQDIDMYRVKLDPHSSWDSILHLPDVEEYIVMRQGKLCIKLGDEKISLNSDQILRFEADQPHTYMNEEDELCVFDSFLYYPKDALEREEKKEREALLKFKNNDEEEALNV